MASSMMTAKQCIDKDIKSFANSDAKAVKEYIILTAKDKSAKADEFAIRDGDISFTITPDTAADAVEKALEKELGFDVEAMSRKDYLQHRLKKGGAGK